MKDENKKETDLDLLARIIMQRFDKVDADISDVRNDIKVLNRKIDSMQVEINTVHTEIGGITKRLDSQDRKNVGTVASLDEVATKKELTHLESRIAVLETSRV